MIIDNGICQKATVISYLEYFINMHKNREDKSFSEAISRWESDRDYIEKYKQDNARRVGVNSITRK